MAINIQTSTGKTRTFNDVFDYFEYTEKYGFQDIIADDIGNESDFALTPIPSGEVEEIGKEWCPEKE